MANSILGSNNNMQPGSGANSLNPQIINQLNAFKKSYKGDPKQAVMQMLQQGRITNPQLQQAMQMAKQIQSMLK